MGKNRYLYIQRCELTFITKIAGCNGGVFIHPNKNTTWNNVNMKKIQRNHSTTSIFFFPFFLLKLSSNKWMTMNRIENGFKCTDLHFLWHPYYYPDVVHYHQPPIQLQVIQNKLRTLLFFYTFYKFFTHHGMCSFSLNKNITSLRCRIEWRFNIA